MKNKIIKSLAVLFCALTIAAGSLQNLGTVDIIREAVPSCAVNGGSADSIDVPDCPYGK